MTTRPIRSFEERRAHAVPMRPVADPAGWYPGDIADAARWRYTVSDTERAEIEAAAEEVAARGLRIQSIRQEDFPLPAFGAAIEAVRAALQAGPGFAQIRGLPAARWDKRFAAAAFWGIGTHLGRALPQNAAGDLLGHIKDLGGDYDDPGTRGYLTNARMGFHADPCDYVALFCLRQAKSGGASRIASSVTVYNEMLRRRPDLVPELTAPSYWTLHGEVSPGEKPWYALPVFAFHDGVFSAKGVSAHIMKSQAVPGVPKYSERRLEAFALFREIAAELSAEVALRPGDVLIVHNHIVLHSRDAFEDWPEPERKRHLYRLWLNDDAHARPMPHAFRAHIQGIHVAGVAPRALPDAASAA